MDMVWQSVFAGFAMVVGLSVSHFSNAQNGLADVLADGVIIVRSNDIKVQALTIYPDDLALITETRLVKLPAGITEIIFENVSEKMIPTSALLRGFTGVRIEQNFDAQTLGKGSLLSAMIGQSVTLTRTDHHSGSVTRQNAKIISASQRNGQVRGAVFEINGKLEVLQCSGQSERVQFDTLKMQGIAAQGSGGLQIMPSLSLRVRADQAGEQEFVFSYLARGLGWKADYRVQILEGQKADILAWLSIDNQTARSFKNAELMVVAGTLNKRGNLAIGEKNPNKFFANCWAMQSTQTPILLSSDNGNHIPNLSAFRYDRDDMRKGVMRPMSAYSQMDEIVVTAARREVKQEDLGDYKLYRINQRLNVEAYQSKQIRFMNEKSVELEQYYRFEIPYYEFRGGNENLHRPQLICKFNNDRERKWGKPVPKGMMRLFKQSANKSQIIVGQTQIKDTPIDQDVRAELDFVDGVTVQTHVYDQSEFAVNRDIKQKFEHTIYNSYDRDITIEMALPFAKGDHKISAMSEKMALDKDPNTWSLSVPANGSKKLSYTVLEKERQ